MHFLIGLDRNSSILISDLNVETLKIGKLFGNVSLSLEKKSNESFKIMIFF